MIHTALMSDSMVYQLKLISFLSILCLQGIAQNEMPDWPAEIEVRGQKVTIYQPQTENYTGDRIDSRAAFAVEVDDKPIFGAMWFTSRVVTDKDQRIVEFDKIQVVNVKFPEENQDNLDTFQDDINKIFENVDLSMSLDQFLADQEELKERKEIDLDFNNAAPTIYFETVPSVLVMIDGDPILKDIDNSSYKYVLNTPFFILSDTKTGTNYLKGGNWWYSSSSLTKNWAASDNVPTEVKQIADKAFTDVESETDSSATETSPPKVILSTKPAELIQTDGEPAFNPVTNTNLLFVDNSESDIIMSIDLQEYFVLVSGRWYKSKSMTSGSWTFVRSDQLPEDFKNIPEDSDLANVRPNVAGTQEAREAILENSIPQTAEVDRKTATVEVKYDGNPKFEKIEGTDLLFASNADKTVLQSKDKYYCVDEGIWFESSQASGPWAVSVVVPEGVEDIPPSSSVYNVKYVYIYDSTPEVVYVGYTPGYYGSYPYYGSVIYGTGYYYRPWYGAYYYPRPVTYGFGVHYNPWTGWGFSYGVSFGWLSFSFHSGGYNGWWGPGGYRYGYRHGYYHGYRHGYNRGYAHGYAAGRRAGYRASNNPQRPNNLPSNAYKNRTTGIKNTGVRPRTGAAQRPSTAARPSNRPAQPSTGARPATKPSQPSNAARPATRPATDASRAKPANRPNNVYSDKSGNIYRQNNSGNWQQRSSGSWQNSGNKSVPSSVNQSYQNRNRGQQRVQSYQRSAPSGGAYRGGGGRRGR